MVKKSEKNNTEQLSYKQYLIVHFSDNFVYIPIESAAKSSADSLPDQVGYFFGFIVIYLCFNYVAIRTEIFSCKLNFKIIIET